MTRLFVLSHVAHRFRSDFFPCGSHVRRAPCAACGANLNGWSAPLLYWWEYEFGDPRSSLAAGHHCFWGSFQWMVDPRGRAFLERSAIPFRFHLTRMTEGTPLSDAQSSLVCVTVDSGVDADAEKCRNAICEACGRFTERRRQITRLRIPASAIPEWGVFTIRQNGPSGPMFATEAARATLVQTGITGIGFHPAGRVMGPLRK